jgi:hypothetical protein
MKPIINEKNYILSNVQKLLLSHYSYTLSGEDRRIVADFLYSMITEEFEEILPFLKLIARLEKANDRETATGIFSTIYAVRAVKQVDFTEASYRELESCVGKLGKSDRESVWARVTTNFIEKKGLSRAEGKEDRLRHS